MAVTAASFKPHSLPAAKTLEPGMFQRVADTAAKAPLPATPALGPCLARHPDNTTTRTIKATAGFHAGPIEFKGDISRSVERKEGLPDKDGKGTYTVTITEKGTADLSGEERSGATPSGGYGRKVSSTYKFDTKEDADRASAILLSPVTTVKDMDWVRGYGNGGENRLVSRSVTNEVSGTGGYMPGGASKIGDALGNGVSQTGTLSQTQTVEYGPDGKATKVSFKTESVEDIKTNTGSAKVGGEYGKASGSTTMGAGTSDRVTTSREISYDLTQDPDAGERLSAKRDDINRTIVWDTTENIEEGLKRGDYLGAEDPATLLKEKGRLDTPTTLTVTRETNTPQLAADGPKQIKTTRTETTENPSLVPGGTPDDRMRTIVDEKTQVTSQTKIGNDTGMEGPAGITLGGGTTDETETVEQEVIRPTTDLDGNPVVTGR